MKKILLAINMALPLILAAWPQELTADQKADEEKFNELAEKFAHKIEKSGATDEETKNFIQNTAEKIYPGLLASGSGSKAKNEELFAQINQDKLSETSVDLQAAILKAIDEVQVDKEAEDKLEEQKKNKEIEADKLKKTVPPKPDPSPTIRKHTGPKVSTTPTAMEEKYGVRFDQEGKNTPGQHIALQTVTVLNMLHDLQRHPDASEKQKEDAAATIEIYEKGLALALTIFK